MPLENNIKVQSSATIKDKIIVNIKEVDPYPWSSISSRDLGDGTIGVKDEYDTARVETMGTANVSEFAEVDLSELNNQVAGTYPVYTFFKEKEATYNVVVKPMTMTIECGGMTKDFIYGDELYFDGVCYATYAKESLSGIVDPTNITFDEPEENVGDDVTVEYVDDYYNISNDFDYKIRIHPETNENSQIMDFSQIEDFDEWGQSYSEHTLEYDYCTIVMIANHQPDDQPINDIPVTRQNPVTITPDEIRRYIDGISFGLTQGGNKTQVAYIKYSEDGGITGTQSEASWNDFWIRGTAPEDTYITNIEIDFGSNNQVGLCYAVLYTHLEDEPIHRVRITGPSSVNADESVDWLVSCVVPIEEVTWEVIEGDGEVELEPYEDEGLFYCSITGVSAGTVTIRATCEDGTYDEKDLLIIGGGGGTETYTVEVTFADCGGENQEDITGTEYDADENVLYSFSKGAGGTPTKYFTANAGIRSYAKNIITISLVEGVDGTIDRIEYLYKQGSNPYTSDVPTFDGESKIWANTSGNEVNSVVLTGSGSNGYVVFSGLKITYTINV